MAKLTAEMALSELKRIVSASGNDRADQLITFFESAIAASPVTKIEKMSFEPNDIVIVSGDLSPSQVTRFRELLSLVNSPHKNIVIFVGDRDQLDIHKLTIDKNDPNQIICVSGAVTEEQLAVFQQRLVHAGFKNHVQYIGDSLLGVKQLVGTRVPMLIYPPEGPDRF